MVFGNESHLDVRQAECRNNPQILDAGLEHLKRLTKLKYLILDKTRVPDAGLEHLKGLTNLKHLCLYNTQVAHAGVASFEKALPNCQIERFR